MMAAAMESFVTSAATGLAGVPWGAWSTVAETGSLEHTRRHDTE
jgi:hypothetical protein